MVFQPKEEEASVANDIPDPVPIEKSVSVAHFEEHQKENEIPIDVLVTDTPSSSQRDALSDDSSSSNQR